MKTEKIELVLDSAIHITEELSLEDEFPNVTYSIIIGDELVLFDNKIKATNFIKQNFDLEGEEHVV